MDQRPKKMDESTTPMGKPHSTAEANQSAMTPQPLTGADESTPNLKGPYDAPSLKHMGPLPPMPTPEPPPTKTTPLTWLRSLDPSLIKTIVLANVLQFSLIALICLICYECGATASRRAARPGVDPPACLVDRGPTTVNSSENLGRWDPPPPRTPAPPPTPPPRNPAV